MIQSKQQNAGSPVARLLAVGWCFDLPVPWQSASGLLLLYIWYFPNSKNTINDNKEAGHQGIAGELRNKARFHSIAA